MKINGRKTKKNLVRKKLLNQAKVNRFISKQKVGFGKTVMLVEFECTTIVIEPKNT